MLDITFLLNIFRIDGYTHMFLIFHIEVIYAQYS